MFNCFSMCNCSVCVCVLEPLCKGRLQGIIKSAEVECTVQHTERTQDLMQLHTRKKQKHRADKNLENLMKGHTPNIKLDILFFFLVISSFFHGLLENEKENKQKIHNNNKVIQFIFPWIILVLDFLPCFGRVTSSQKNTILHRIELYTFEKQMTQHQPTHHQQPNLESQVLMPTHLWKEKRNNVKKIGFQIFLIKTSFSVRTGDTLIHSAEFKCCCV